MLVVGVHLNSYYYYCISNFKSHKVAAKILIPFSMLLCFNMISSFGVSPAHSRECKIFQRFSFWSKKRKWNNVLRRGRRQRGLLTCSLLSCLTSTIQFNLTCQASMQHGNCTRRLWLYFYVTGSLCLPLLVGDCSPKMCTYLYICSSPQQHGSFLDYTSISFFKQVNKTDLLRK